MDDGVVVFFHRTPRTCEHEPTSWARDSRGWIREKERKDKHGEVLINVDS